MLPAIARWRPIPTPSMTASRIAQLIAPFLIALGPPLTASDPPVKKPAMMAFHGSSFFLTPFTAQSNVLNSPPHTPKFPPSTGALAFIAVSAVQCLSFAVHHSYIRHDAHTSYPSFTIRTVSVSFDTVPYCSTNRLYLVISNRKTTLQSDIHTPIQNAPPKSDKATHGQGSRE